MVSAIEFQGRHFTVPAPITALANDGERLALAVVSGGAVRFGRDLVEDAMRPGAADLSLVATGRCPLLMEHSYNLDSLLGAVVAAEIDGPVLRAVTKFARTPEADRIWNLLAQGFPLSLSAGVRVEHAEVIEELPEGCLIRCTSWQLRELSVCVWGKDPTANLRQLSWDHRAREIVERMNDPNHPARAVASAALRLDDWRRWGVAAGVRLAETLAVDRDGLCDLLDAEVAAHSERLIESFAGARA